MNWILETQRLALREFVSLDAEQMYLLNNDPMVIQYTGDKAFLNIQEALDFLIHYKDYSNNGIGRWACIDKKTNDCIGWCGLKKHEDGSVDLGYRYFQKYWNKGYASESALACVQYGFTKKQLDEIIGRSDKDNIASIKVLEKCGMQYWKSEDVDHIENASIYRITSDMYFNK